MVISIDDRCKQPLVVSFGGRPINVSGQFSRQTVRRCGKETYLL